MQKITQPLEESRVESTTLQVRGEKVTLEERIVLEDKGFFEVEEIVVTETKEMWLNGMLVSLNKSTNRGSFYLNDGTRVPYRLAAEKPEEMYIHFIYKGPVKVRCKASLDENLKPAHVDIFEIVQLQNRMI